MARALTAARAAVAPGRAEEYLATLRELGTRMRRRGEHLWVFRHPSAPGEFLEFSESPSPGTHRVRRDLPAEERALEVKLRTLATYAPDAWVLWEEIPLEEP
jgi:hypothetical protein